MSFRTGAGKRSRRLRNEKRTMCIPSVTSLPVAPAPVSKMNTCQTQCTQDERSAFHYTPEKLVFVLHELGFEQVDCGCTHAESLQVSHEGGKERMVCVELYLACRKTCRPSVSRSASLLESGMLRHGKKKKLALKMRKHEAYRGNQ